MWWLILIPFCCASDTGGTGLFPRREAFKTEAACLAEMKRTRETLERRNFEPGVKFKKGVNYDIRCEYREPRTV